MLQQFASTILLSQPACTGLQEKVVANSVPTVNTHKNIMMHLAHLCSIAPGNTRIRNTRRLVFTASATYTYEQMAA